MVTKARWHIADGSLLVSGNNDYMQLVEGTTANITFPTLMPVFACVLVNEQFETSKYLIIPIQAIVL